MNELKTLICSKCGIEKSIDNFYKRKGRKFGYQRQCKECMAIKSKERRKTNYEAYRKRRLTYQNANREKCRIACRESYYKNVEKYSEDHKRWRSEHPEKCKEYNKRSYLKRQATIKGRLSNNMKSRMWQSLHHGKNGEHWEDVVGYCCDNLRRRLTKTMPKGYTWKDFMNGKLHIDHIIPVSIFNYKDIHDYNFKRCWALNNLQLLPAKENQVKGTRLIRPFQPALAF